MDAFVHDLPDSHELPQQLTARFKEVVTKQYLVMNLFIRITEEFLQKGGEKEQLQWKKWSVYKPRCHERFELLSSMK
jgi:hypothetical protein